MIKSGLPPIHPGEFLAETLEELGVSQAQFARAIGVSPMRTSHIINGTRPVPLNWPCCLAARWISRRNTGSTCKQPTTSRLPRRHPQTVADRH